ncbi:MAG: 3-oxoacyl-[acyl-carrier-protein] synthase III C-terminal domain-containing protein [Myxococcales bacterium]|jgi:3-oxoacyl-[acyl-carrier-protein] synthase-3
MLPKQRMTTAEVMAEAAHDPHVDLQRLTGIEERRVCGEGEDSLTLAVGAARDCLAHSRHGAGDLDMLISCGITKFDDGLSHRLEPPLSLSVKQQIGASRAHAFDLSNACAGMLTGVLVLENFIRRGAIERGMVVSGEFISNLRHEAAAKIRSVLSDRLASLTLGDAGAACIVERAPRAAAGIRVVTFTTLAAHSRLCIGIPSPVGPGGSMKTRAREIHRVATVEAPPLMFEALEEAGLSLQDIDHFIPHQTSARAIKKGVRELAERYGVTPKNVVITVDRFANTASTTHFVAMRELLRRGTLRAGEHVMLLALASGLEVGVVIFTLDEMAERYGRQD